MQIISRKEAQASGLDRYFTGKPCKYGHVSERYIGGICVICSKNYQSNPRQVAKRIARNRASYKAMTEEQRRKKQERVKEWRARNIERERARSRAYYAADRERHRGYWIKNQYGVTPDQYQELIQQQDGKCAICRAIDTGSVHRKSWHVDHCHKTGIVRGLLCHRCNLMLGNAKDNPDSLRAAADYLERTAPSIKEAA